MSNTQTVKQTPMEPVTIDYAVLESQGWEVKEFPEFYDGIAFMYTPDSIGAVYINRDDDGDIKGIYAITHNNELEKRSLTVNDVTFSNFTAVKVEPRTTAAGYQTIDKHVGCYKVCVDIENPIDKRIQVHAYEIDPKPDPFWYDLSLSEYEHLYLDHSKKQANLGYFNWKNNPKLIIVLDVQFLPTPKRGGDKIIQTTEWIPVGEERKIQLPNFAVFMKMEQLRPRGNLILTARLDTSTGVTMLDAYENQETITIRLKFEDGSIWEGELYSSLLRKNLLQIMSSQGTEISKTTVKLDSWQATIESIPLLQE